MGGLQRRHVLAILQRPPVLARQLTRRHHQQHIAFHAFFQALATQHQIQRLLPWHLMQTQGYLALHRIAGDQVHAGKIGQHLQHRAHFYILEIQ
ncbi:hypothetical protein D3C80_1799190 [compost metagenome]